MISYDPKAVAHAKRDKLYLFRCEFNGKFLGRGSMRCSGTMTVAERESLDAWLLAWFKRQARDVKKRKAALAPRRRGR